MVGGVWFPWHAANKASRLQETVAPQYWVSVGAVVQTWPYVVFSVDPEISTSKNEYPKPPT